MIKTIFKTVTILTIILSIAFTIFVSFFSDFSFGRFIYIIILVPFTVFLGPTLILTTIYSFIYKKLPSKTLKFKRNLIFIGVTAMSIIIWFIIEIWDWQPNFQLWTKKLIKERLEHSEMGFGVIIFIPLCFLTSYLFDRFSKKVDSDNLLSKK